MEAARLRQELELSRRAASEWMDRLRKLQGRVDAIWNLAVDACRDRLGRHIPPCADNCRTCYINKELASLRRMDMAGYIPVKERLRTNVNDLVEKSHIKDAAQRRAYSRGLHDLLKVADSMLADRE